MTSVGAILLQAVDVVGQAGKPKTITGFQTHTTPVLLAYGERAELATEECILYIHHLRLLCFELRAATVEHPFPTPPR